MLPTIDILIVALELNRSLSGRVSSPFRTIPKEGSGSDDANSYHDFKSTALMVFGFEILGLIDILLILIEFVVTGE